ncbi:MAG: hypothetical protein PHN84_02700 [Desulfuromonadaceae bacterium]|nr:hypothetical protein [Desulfuromonadaceae bacterium]MDD2854721.1 hypothetical protein [Desulfuromonadaceae bacterium]
MISENLLPFVTPIEIYMMLRGFIPVVIIVIVGIIIGKWDASKHQLTLIKLTNYIFLPCLAFSALHKHAFDCTEIIAIALGVLIIISATTIVSVFVLGEKFRGGSKNILAAVYMSSGTLMPPLAFVLFGNEGLAKAIYFHLFVIIYYNTLGLWMVEGTGNLKAILKTPLVYLVILGVAARIFPFSLPDTVEEFAWLAEKGVDLTAMGALPLLLISFGYPLGLLKISDFKGGVKGGLLRVVVSPLVALLVVYIYRKTGLLNMDRGYDILGFLDQRTTEALLILGAALPTSNYALHMHIDNDEVKAEKRITGTLLVSVVASVVTIPVVLLLILMFIFTD